MISKDLMNLIHAYNENGIYFLFDSILWWFNGKRIEKWCHCPDIVKIFVYDGKLYGLITDHGKLHGFVTDHFVFQKVFVLENQQFNYHMSMKEIFKIAYDYINPYCVCLDDNGNKYTSTNNDTLRKNGKPLPNKTHKDYGFKLLYYDGFLYFFTCFKDGINEKFDIKTNQWSLFSSQELSEIHDIYLLNKLFYILFRNGKIGTYNSKTDTWQLLSISLHRKKTNKIDNLFYF